MKLIRESLANISIFPEKNLVVTLTEEFLLTVHEFMLTALSQSNSIIIFVLGLLSALLVFCSQSLKLNFLS